MAELSASRLSVSSLEGLARRYQGAPLSAQEFELF
jgi:hypothetical protein